MSKVTLSQEATFTATYGERTLHGLLRESWHGLDRLLDANGRDLILNDGTVVKGHPDMLRDLGLTTARPGFIRVPARTIKFKGGGEHTEPEFYVAQRKASKGDDGKIVHDINLKPWVNISHINALEAVKVAGLNMLTGWQSLSLALDIAEQDINWTGGKVGEGKVFQGLHRGTVKGPVDGHYESPHADERRWLQLSTGERIWDYIGHVYEHLFDNIHSRGDVDGIVREAFGINSPYLTLPPYPSMEKGMGWRPGVGDDWSGGALVRGGFWSDGGYAGLCGLDFWSPRDGSDRVGVRCTL